MCRVTVPGYRRDRRHPLAYAARVTSTRPTRVALALLTFVPGGMGGTETYLRELIAGLHARSDIEVVPVVARNVADGLPGAVGVPGIHAADGILPRLIAVLKGFAAGRRVVRRIAPDVVHHPVTILTPRRTGVPTVVTVHDTQHHDLPHLFSRAERIFRWFAYDRSTRAADVVVTVSEFSKRSIVRHLGIPADRIRVIPLAVDAQAFAPHLGERDEFVLYPARGWKHKNHATLLEAMAIARRTRPDLRLVLTGGALERLGALPDWVDVRGLVSADELRRLYATAGALAFPSQYEGFGMPPLEAMASGCPVASSTAGSLPEVCGDAAVYFDPDDAAGMAEAILQAMLRRDELVPLGLERARLFTWERCVAAHAELYARLAATATPSAS